MHSALDYAQIALASQQQPLFLALACVAVPAGGPTVAVHQGNTRASACIWQGVACRAHLACHQAQAADSLLHALPTVKLPLCSWSRP